MASSNLPLPKRAFTSNPSNSVYDDVFGGAPNFGTPTLAPRLQDYAEIFGGFHSSRSSSIPVIDIPIVDSDDSELHFTYGEVFGESRGFDYTASFEDVVGQSSAGYDSSDESWSPAKSGTLSDELDPLAGSETSCRLSDAGADSHKSLQCKKKLDVSYSKSGRRVMDEVFAEASDGIKFGAGPEHTVSHFEAPISGDREFEVCTEPVIDDVKHKKCLSNPSESGSYTRKSDYSHSEEHESDTFSLERPFVSVSDFSLRTKPSRLPPPSRPPPALVDKKEDKKEERPGLNSKHKVSKSYGYDRVVDGSTAGFDMDVDAIPSIGAIRNGNENVNMKRVSSKGSVDRVDSWDDSKWHLEDGMEEVQVHHTAGEYDSFQSHKKEEHQGLHSKHKISKSYGSDIVVDGSTAPFDVDVDAIPSIKAFRNDNKIFNVKRVSTKGSVERVDSWDDSKWHLEDAMEEEEQVHQKAGEYDSFQGKRILQSHRKRPTTSPPSAKDRKEEFPVCGGLQFHQPFTDIPQCPVAWRKETEYFEVIEKDISAEHIEVVAESNINVPIQFQNPEVCRNSNTTESKASSQKEDGDTQDAARWDGKRNQFEMMGESYYGSNKHRSEETEMLSGGRKEFSEHNQQQAGERVMPNIDLDLSEHGGVEVGCIQKDAAQNYSSNASSEINRFRDAQTRKMTNEKFEKSLLSEQYQQRLHNVGREGISERVNERNEQEATEKQQYGASWLGNQNKLVESHMLVENEQLAKDATENEESVKEACEAILHECNADEKFTLFADKDKVSSVEAVEEISNDLTFIIASEQAKDDKGQHVVSESVIRKERTRDVILETDNDLRDSKSDTEPNKSLSSDTGSEKLSEEADEDELIELDENDVRINWDHVINAFVKGDNMKIPDQEHKFEEEAATTRDGTSHITEKSQERAYCGAKTEDHIVNGHFNSVGINKNELQAESSSTGKRSKLLSSPEQLKDSNMGGIRRESACTLPEKIACTLPEKTASPIGSSHEIGKVNSSEENKEPTIKQTPVIIKAADVRASSTTCGVVKGSIGEDASSVSGHNEDQLCSRKYAKDQIGETRDRNVKETIAAKDQKIGDRIRRDIELENEHLRKLEEEREREREREKDRMAVDKAAFDAYEKSYAEAREKAERAAVARATAEVRQRAMAQARERLERASLEARQRTEYATMERASAETRQRAMEKSMAERAAFERIERSAPGKFSVSYGSSDMKQGSKSSDIHFQDRGTSNGLRHSTLPANAGAEGESPQRNKARLERYRRTAERAANALAEKTKRDIFAQKEREERNRIAETLDAEVKRWSRGKEGNLRALLSTLQYILGSNSGWQPVPLTEVITTVAVKKAYRKATLFVHPDKLQQRGATLQQKYICEKVFDLLKEAWNKFNSEEW